jgi:vancomycin resistance protein YoaR
MDATGAVQYLPLRWELDEARIATMLTVRSAQATEGRALAVDLDRQQLRAWLAPIVEQIARAPREGRYTYDAATQSLGVVSPGQIGYALDLDAATEVLAAACLSTERLARLPLLVIPPLVTRADLEALLPLDLVGEGESSFRGSTADRLLNIKVASARFDGVVVPPRSTFSFLYHLGLVTQANGYSLSWVIMGDRTELGPGGGVCQVSTTCYRAAFWGGFPMVERRPHSYRVSWYEPPLGLDAAVFSPTADMRFQNDTDTPLVIMTEVDEANAKLYFRFYGRSIGRKVTMEGPQSGNPVPAPAPVEELDPTLAPGQRVQVETARDGLDVTLTRVIEQPGQETRREEVLSRYEAWPARYRVGPAATP